MLRLLITGGALMCAAAGPARSPAHRAPFQFRLTSPAAAARFAADVRRCSETPAFAALIAGIPDSLPIAIRAADTITDVLFGTPADARSEPLLQIDLSEMQALPLPGTVRSWSADSSWAFTRCEALAHEVAEALAYRTLWRKRPAGETLDESGGQYARRIRWAHARALEVERDVAVAQATRVDSTGRPYRRTRECFGNATVNIIIGPHTETLLLGDAALLGIRYQPNRDLCVSHQ
jgi:hypothetical protein